MQAAPMSRSRYMQEHRKMRFEEAYQGWTGGRLTQAVAALLLGQCERSFRRHVERYKADGLEGLLGKRLVHPDPSALIRPGVRGRWSRLRPSGCETDGSGLATRGNP